LEPLGLLYGDSIYSYSIFIKCHLYIIQKNMVIIPGLKELEVSGGREICNYRKL
jgi:hypothetical protein